VHVFTTPFSSPSFIVDFTISFTHSAISSYGLIPRHPRSHYLPLYEDPEDWTPTVIVTRGTPVYLRAGGLIFRDEQPHNITTLLTHLLGKEMIDREASCWTGTDFSLPLKYHGHQLDWTRYILAWERDILCSSGIYSCIFLPMF
jgi:hypothetical protein